jgi:hypothetical protein
MRFKRHIKREMRGCVMWGVQAAAALLRLTSTAPVLVYQGMKCKFFCTLIPVLPQNDTTQTPGNLHFMPRGTSTCEWWYLNSSSLLVLYQYRRLSSEDFCPSELPLLLTLPRSCATPEDR